MIQEHNLARQETSAYTTAPQKQGTPTHSYYCRTRGRGTWHSQPAWAIVSRGALAPPPPRHRAHY